MSKRFMRLPEPSASLEDVRSFIDWQIEKLEDLEIEEVISRSLGLILYYNALSPEQRARLVDRIVEFMTALKVKLSKTQKSTGLIDYTIGVGSAGGAELSLRFEAPSPDEKNK